MGKLYEPLTDSIKDTSRDMTNFMMLISKENNKAPRYSNDKFLGIMNDRGNIANFLMSPLSKITNFEIVDNLN